MNHMWKSITFDSVKNIFKIDFHVLPAKIATFLFTARASYQAYLVLFLTNVGLSTSQAGLINGLRLLGGTVGAPFWTLIADVYHCHKKILPMTTLLAIITMSCFPFLTVLFPKSDSNNCFSNFTRDANTTMHTDSEFGSMGLFFVMLFASIFISFFDGSILCFIDSATVYRCNSTTPKRKYAHQRIFECFGWPFGVFIIGLFVDNFPFSEITCYAGIYLFYPIVMLFLLVNDIFLLRNTDLTRQVNDSIEKKNDKAWKMVRKLLSERDHIIFFTSIAILGAGQGIYEGFTFPLLTEFGATTTDTTIFSVTAGVASFFAFIFGDFILRRISDIFLIIPVCSFLYTIRYPVFYFVTNTNILLVTSIFQIGHILFIMAMVRHIDTTYPSKVSTTLFGIANAGYYAFGYGLANIIGGIIYNNYGGEKLFLGMAMMFAVWALCILLYRFCFKDSNIRKGNNAENHEKHGPKQNEKSFAKVVSYNNEAIDIN